MLPYCSTSCHQKQTGDVNYGLAQVQNSSLSFRTYHGHLLFVQLDSVSTYQAKRKEEEEFFLLLCFTSVGLCYGWSVVVTVVLSFFLFTSCNTNCPHASNCPCSPACIFSPICPSFLWPTVSRVTLWIIWYCCTELTLSVDWFRLVLKVSVMCATHCLTTLGLLASNALLLHLCPPVF